MPQLITLPSISVLFASVWREYSNRFPLFFVIGLIANLPGIVLQVAMTYVSDEQWIGPVMIVAGIAMIVMGVWGQIALSLAARSQARTGWEYFFLQGIAKFWPVFLVAILLSLAVMGGTVLLIIPGIIFAIWFNFSYFFVIYENKGVIDSMKASKALVKGNVFSVFVRQLMVMFACFIVALIIGLATSGNPLISGIASGIISALIVPFIVLYNYRLYTALKQPAV